MKKLNIETASIVAQDANERKTFTDAMRAFETAFFTGDYADQIQNLAQAIANSVLKTMLDPQRKTAPERKTVSNSGFNPAIMAVKVGAWRDTNLITNTRENGNAAYRLSYNGDGELVQEVADTSARDAYNTLASKTLSDGIDIVQTAIMELMRVATDEAVWREMYGDTETANWLEKPVLERGIDRRVLIKETDSAKYGWMKTTPIQHCYQTVREYVDNSRAVKADPKSGYTYIDAMEEGLEGVYRRMSKYADIGGYDCNGLYTAGNVEFDRYEAIIKALELSDRQDKIVKLRMNGFGTQAIATYLGVSEGSICNTLSRIRTGKCEKIGFTPEMWREMTRRFVDIERGRE